MSAVLRTFFGLLLVPGMTPSVASPAAPSFFHLALTKSEPMKDSTVISPKAIKLWFTEKPTLALSKITLTGPDKKAIPLGKVTMDNAAKAPLAATVTGTLAPGAYTVNWTTASSDGHAVTGTFGFTVRAAK